MLQVRDRRFQTVQGVTEMDAKALNILVVDDDEVDVMNVMRAFKKMNITNALYEAPNGVEALKMLRSNAVPAERRLVLLDINMPRMSGIEFLQEVRKDPALKSLSVIVLTTSNADRDRFEAYELNVAGYLVKPVSFVDFVELMAALNRFWTLVEI